MQELSLNVLDIADVYKRQGQQQYRVKHSVHCLIVPINVSQQRAIFKGSLIPYGSSAFLVVAIPAVVAEDHISYTAGIFLRLVSTADFVGSGGDVYKRQI